MLHNIMQMKAATILSARLSLVEQPRFHTRPVKDHLQFDSFQNLETPVWHQWNEYLSIGEQARKM
jgi:hypothetical protein